MYRVSAFRVLKSVSVVMIVGFGVSFSLIQTEVNDINFSFSSRITIKKQMICTSRDYTAKSFAVADFQRNKGHLMIGCAFCSHVPILATQYCFLLMQ